MTRQRKYLDTKRRVLLQGRPIYPDWGLLLHLGKRAVDRGWADEAPFLSDVMWRGINEGGVWPQPAAFCNELLREWLTVDEPAACSFLREQWGHVRAPETSAEAVERLSADDCHERGIDHRLRSAWSTNELQNDVTWAVGWCTDCARVLLWRFVDDEITTWPYYNHNAPAVPR